MLKVIAVIFLLIALGALGYALNLLLTFQVGDAAGVTCVAAILLCGSIMLLTGKQRRGVEQMG